MTVKMKHTPIRIKREKHVSSEEGIIQKRQLNTTDPINHNHSLNSIQVQ